MVIEIMESTSISILLCHHPRQSFHPDLNPRLLCAINLDPLHEYPVVVIHRHSIHRPRQDFIPLLAERLPFAGRNDTAVEGVDGGLVGDFQAAT